MTRHAAPARPQPNARRAGVVSAGVVALALSGGGLAFAGTTPTPSPTPCPSPTPSLIGNVTCTVQNTTNPVTQPVQNAVSQLLSPGAAPTQPPAPGGGTVPGAPGGGGAPGGTAPGSAGGGTHPGGSSHPTRPTATKPGTHPPTVRSIAPVFGSAGLRDGSYPITSSTLPTLDLSSNTSAFGMMPVDPGRAPAVAAPPSGSSPGGPGTVRLSTQSGSPAGGSLPEIVVIIAVAAVGAVSAAHIGVLQQKLARSASA